jgi:K+ transporter
MFLTSGFFLVLSLAIFLFNARLRERVSFSLGGAASVLLALAIVLFISAWARKSAKGMKRSS